MIGDRAFCQNYRDLLAVSVERKFLAEARIKTVIEGKSFCVKKKRGLVLKNRK